MAFQESYNWSHLNLQLCLLSISLVPVKLVLSLLMMNRKKGIELAYILVAPLEVVHVVHLNHSILRMGKIEPWHGLGTLGTFLNKLIKNPNEAAAYDW